MASIQLRGRDQWRGAFCAAIASGRFEEVFRASSYQDVFRTEEVVGGALEACDGEIPAWLTVEARRKPTAFIVSLLVSRYNNLDQKTKDWLRRSKSATIANRVAESEIVKDASEEELRRWAESRHPPVRYALATNPDAPTRWRIGALQKVGVEGRKIPNYEYEMDRTDGISKLLSQLEIEELRQVVETAREPVGWEALSYLAQRRRTGEVSGREIAEMAWKLAERTVERGVTAAASGESLYARELYLALVRGVRAYGLRTPTNMYQALFMGAVSGAQWGPPRTRISNAGTTTAVEVNVRAVREYVDAVFNPKHLQLTGEDGNLSVSPEDIFPDDLKNRLAVTPKLTVEAAQKLLPIAEESGNYEREAATILRLIPAEERNQVGRGYEPRKLLRTILPEFEIDEVACLVSADGLVGYGAKLAEWLESQRVDLQAYLELASAGSKKLSGTQVVAVLADDA